MRNQIPLIIVLALLLVGGFILMTLTRNPSDRRLDNSVIGLNGLSLWLEQNDVAVRQSNPRLTPNIDDLSLRVLPLYDMNLLEDAARPTNIDELISQQTQRDMGLDDFNQKITDVPTVVLLPKWTTGFIEYGIAHKRTLIPEGAFERLFDLMRLGGLRLTRGGPEFTTTSSRLNENHDIALFHMQSFVPGSLPKTCRPYVKEGNDILAISCRLADANHDLIVVSDPDLFNNHGLSLAENANFATEFLSMLTPDNGNSIYVDTEPLVLAQYEFVEDERQDYTRSGSDLARFFEYPLSLLWAVMFFVLAVLFWRGAVRFGPLDVERKNASDHSKTVAIATKARLLRLSDSDGQMVADFVRNQLMDLTTSTLGLDASEAGQKRFFAHLSRRDASLAKAFQSTSEHLISNADRMPHAELFKVLDTYKNLLEKVENSNGFIGISKTR